MFPIRAQRHVDDRGIGLCEIRRTTKHRHGKSGGTDASPTESRRRHQAGKAIIISSPSASNCRHLNQSTDMDRLPAICSK
jgi:hypothetical protein